LPLGLEHHTILVEHRRRARQPEIAGDEDRVRTGLVDQVVFADEERPAVAELRIETDVGDEKTTSPASTACVTGRRARSQSRTKNTTRIGNGPKSAVRVL
jgi:hypothetical protein